MINLSDNKLTEIFGIVILMLVLMDGFCASAEGIEKRRFSCNKK